MERSWNAARTMNFSDTEESTASSTRNLSGSRDWKAFGSPSGTEQARSSNQNLCACDSLIHKCQFIRHQQHLCEFFPRIQRRNLLFRSAEIFLCVPGGLSR